MFWNKKKDEIDKIKEAVNPQAKMDLPELSSPETLSNIRTPSIESQPFAPLFVKVDKYRDILNGIQKIREAIRSIKEIVELQKTIENTRADIDNSLDKYLAQLDSALNELDSGFKKPETYNLPQPQMDMHISELQNELNKLHGELKTFK